MRQALVHSAFESVSLHYAVILAVQQHDSQDLLMKLEHVEIGPIDRFGAAERSRQGVLSLDNVAQRKCRYDGLGFTFWEELAQFFERGAGQRFEGKSAAA